VPEHVVLATPFAGNSVAIKIKQTLSTVIHTPKK
jgi:hypothetical protein